jgi:hypothetical protein
MTNGNRFFFLLRIAPFSQAGVFWREVWDTTDACEQESGLARLAIEANQRPHRSPPGKVLANIYVRCR